MGEISYDLESLEDGFEKKVRLLLADLEQDHLFVTRSVYRSPVCQDRLFKVSQKIAAFTGKMGPTDKKGGQSCHNHQLKGEPASLAVDVKPLMIFEEDQVQFYKDLQKQSKKYGLRTGASFRVKEGNRWAKYDMGWDPGHIDVGYQKCKNKLKKMK